MKNLVKHTFLIAAVAILELGWMSIAICQTSDSKILKLGVREDAPPFAFKDDTNSDFQGYSVDLCNLIGKRAKDQRAYDNFSFEPVSSKTRFDDLENKKVDILCEATTVTLGRMRKFSPTLYTFLSGASFMYQKPAIADSGQGKLRIGVLKDTTTKEHFEKAIWPKLKSDLKRLGFKFTDFVIETAEKHWQSTELFRQKNIDIYLADREILFALRRLSNGIDLQVSSKYYTIEPYALFTRRDDVELLNTANTTLRDLYSSPDPRENIQKVLRTNFPGQIFSNTLLQLFRLQRILD